MIVQRGSREILEIAPYQAEGWHKSRASLGTSVQLRSVSSLWSMGSVDLNEVGRSVVHLPKRGSQVGDPPFVVLIEVKIAEPTEHCSVVVVIWQASIETNTSLSIRNDSDVHVTVKQANIDFNQLGLDKGIFEISVAPSQCVPFGWADPDTGSDILVTAGSSMIGTYFNRFIIDTAALDSFFLLLSLLVPSLSNNASLSLSLYLFLSLSVICFFSPS